ncbi:hypothetical protein HDU79_006677 [Rhizoclosmatium sp. JEL0117]|nr:hypothetical protein HDU79_006677 [Rhizoclosmatium sp. JEL0117]
MSFVPVFRAATGITLPKQIPPIGLNVGDSCPADANLLYACSFNWKTNRDSIVQCVKGSIIFSQDCVTNATVAGSGPQCVYQDNGAGNSNVYYLPFCVPGPQRTAPATVATVKLGDSTLVSVPIPSPIYSGNIGLITASVTGSIVSPSATANATAKQNAAWLGSRHSFTLMSAFAFWFL